MRADCSHGGEHCSALRFWSTDPRSLIRSGAGYWRYLPATDGVRFITSYDYQTRFGLPGRLVDLLLFRPLMGWATAWSFDRLRLWIERGIEPAVSLERSLVHALARISVALAWLYQGLVPKLVGPHADELAMIEAAGVPAASAALVAQVIGGMEVLFGLAMLRWWRQRWHFLATIVLMVLATAAVAMHSPRFLLAAFNPLSLNLLMSTLSAVGLVVSRDLPSAGQCLRRPPREKP